MATTLYLIRHGDTIGSEVKRYKGSIDVPMSEAGIAQIKAASAFITDKLRLSGITKYKSYLNDIHVSIPQMPDDKEARLSAVYCSDLSRARRSAEIIAEPYGLEPVVIPELRERNFGVWEGMTFNEIKDRYPDEFEAWASNPLKYRPVDGESTKEVRNRALRALDGILSKHAAERSERKASDNPDPADSIAIVAHGGVNRIILCHLMGIPLENVFRIEQDPAAVNIVEFWERYPVIKLLNGGPVG
ncbi:MAG TPA: histidine phosphatase family protein [Dissulfurispiraceae bacterium]|nr:histidine phosphatase family protein [Dissulfurispiraceae bacterium]